MDTEPLSGKEPEGEPIAPQPTREELLSRMWWRGDSVSTAGVVAGSFFFYAL